MCEENVDAWVDEVPLLSMPISHISVTPLCFQANMSATWTSTTAHQTNTNVHQTHAAAVVSS